MSARKLESYQHSLPRGGSATPAGASSSSELLSCGIDHLRTAPLMCPLYNRPSRAKSSAVTSSRARRAQGQSGHVGAPVPSASAGMPRLCPRQHSNTPRTVSHADDAWLADERHPRLDLHAVGHIVHLHPPVLCARGQPAVLVGLPGLARDGAQMAHSQGGDAASGAAAEVPHLSLEERQGRGGAGSMRVGPQGTTRPPSPAPPRAVFLSPPADAMRSPVGLKSTHVTLLSYPPHVISCGSSCIVVGGSTEVQQRGEGQVPCSLPDLLGTQAAAALRTAPRRPHLQLHSLALLLPEVVDVDGRVVAPCHNVIHTCAGSGSRVVGMHSASGVGSSGCAVAAPPEQGMPARLRTGRDVAAEHGAGRGQRQLLLLSRRPLEVPVRHAAVVGGQQVAAPVKPQALHLRHERGKGTGRQFGQQWWRRGACIELPPACCARSAAQCDAQLYNSPCFPVAQARAWRAAAAGCRPE